MTARVCHALFFPLLLFGLLGAAPPSIPSEAGATVQRALPYLQNEGVKWMDKRGCVSCHQVPFMLWSLRAAHENGFDVDSQKLTEWTDWSINITNFVKPEQKEDVDTDATLESNIDTVNGLLLALPTSKAAAGGDWQQVFRTALVNNQASDGSWKACGQLPMQKRPVEETTQVTVLWSLLALQKGGETRHDHTAALNFCENEQPTSTEWLVARLLLAHSQGKPTSSWRTELIAKQNEDGGWGWLMADESDALATGMGLYALQATKVSSDVNEQATQAAVQFLTESQRENGAWSVPGTKKSAKGKPTATANYWGTAWAVIGLLE